MAYELDIDPRVREQIRELPGKVLPALAEVLAFLELAPWSGEPINKANPNGPVRQVILGADGLGFLTYLILEDQQRVDVVGLVWLDR